MSQPKVEITHVVGAGVVGPQGCKYLTNLAEVLLNISFLDRSPLRGQKSGTDALGENTEERNGVLNVFLVGGDLQPAAEVPPLAPGGGIFLEDGCRKPLIDFFLCSMVGSFFLHPDGRGGQTPRLAMWEVCV